MAIAWGISMTTKAIMRSAAVPADAVLHSGLWLTPPTTTEDCLVRIRALGQRIDRHIDFMSAVGSLAGTSLEAKAKGVAVFYECLRTLEQKLDRIQDNLRLQ
jgi:hypothetical protein